MTILNVTDLVIDYQTPRGSVRAVDGIDLRIEAGETVAVVGETGSGKTTAALSAIGLLPQGATRVRGSVELNGRDITGLSRRSLAAIHGVEVGLIPQDSTASLDPLKTIGWQVSEALRIHRRKDVADELVRSLLERVGLSDTERIARSYPHELSGGQRQRALIAGAIALRPSLLVADESTSALDVTVQRRVLDLLDDLRREDGAGILFVTHDLAVAAERADRIIVLRRGSVRDTGPVNVVLGDGAAGYTRALIENAPALQPATFRERPALHAHDVVSVTEVRKRFNGGVDAVRGVSFAVPECTTHAIVGESGSGKSTIARMLLGWERPTGGTIEVAGHDVATIDRISRRTFRRDVQLVYQSPYASLNPALSILDTVAEPLRRFGLASRLQAKRQAAELLVRMSLPAQLHDRRPRELSGGQRQRVAIARALAPQPRVVVLDEPVSALDVSVQAQILELLDELQRERGLTYVFISHDLAVVRQISDTVTVLRDGIAEESGTTRQIFQTPTSDYTRSLLDAIPRVHLASIEA